MSFIVIRLGILGLCFTFYLQNTGASEFWAGAAKTSLNAPSGVSLAGYGGGGRRHFSLKRQNPYAHLLKANRGVHDDVFAKTLFLRTPESQVLIIGVDLIAASRDLRRDVAQRLSVYGLEERNIILTATHTHSGPSGMSRAPLWQLIATDLFVGEVYQRYLDAIVDSAQDAMAQARPARIGIKDFQVDGITYNRRNQPVMDPTVTLVRVADLEGRTIGTLLNFPIHGTALGTSNLLISADVPGALANELEKSTDGVVVFVNGAEGDISPKVAQKGFEGIQQLAEQFADLVYPQWLNIELSSHARIGVRENEYPLTRPRLNASACAKLKDSHFNFNLPLYHTGLPSSAIIHLLQINSHAFVSVPGEPIAELGLAIKQSGFNLGYSGVSIFGLANDHLSYILTREQYNSGGYEACASLYGPRLGETILLGVQDLMQNIRM